MCGFAAYFDPEGGRPDPQWLADAGAALAHRGPDDHGVLIEDGTKVMEVSPWMLLFPGVLLSATLYCFNFIGDGLRDALDPKDR